MKKFTLPTVIAIVATAINEAREAYADLREESAHITVAEAAYKATFAQVLKEAGIEDASIVEAAIEDSEDAYAEGNIKGFSKRTCLWWGSKAGARAILAALPPEIVDYVDVCVDGHWENSGTYADTVGVLINYGFAVIGLANRPNEYYSYALRHNAEKAFERFEEDGFAPFWVSKGDEARLERLSEIYEDSRC